MAPMARANKVFLFPFFDAMMTSSDIRIPDQDEIVCPGIPTRRRDADAQTVFPE
jgi:hypothetical protein